MWTFVLTDLSFVPQGEMLNLSDVSIKLPLNALDTLTFNMRLDNPFALQIADCEGYIKAYRDGELRFFGPILSVDESGNANGAQLVVNAMSQGWIFSKRITGRSSTGTMYFSDDRRYIMSQILATENTHEDMHIQEENAPAAPTPTALAQYTAGPYKYVSQCLVELTTGLDAFDWRVFPVENFEDNEITSSKIGSFISSDLMATYQPEAVFEWGTTGRYNASEYTRRVSRTDQINVGIHIAPAGPDAPGYPTVYWPVPSAGSDSRSKWGLLEGVVDGDLTSLALRTQLAQEHFNVRNQPRKLVNITPHIADRNRRMPEYGTDYSVGDLVRVRSVYNGSERFNGWARVWAVEFAVSKEGTERVTLTLEESA